MLKGICRACHLLLNKTRTLRISILTIFLSLISISFVLVMTFTYVKNYLAILNFSKSVASRVSSIVLEKFKDFAEDSDRVTKVATGFYNELVPISLHNPIVTSFILNVLKYHQSFSNFYIGLPDGNFLGAFRISHSAQTNFITESNQPLPEGTVYSLRYIEHTAQIPTDHTQYLDANLHVIGSEDVPNVSYDARQRPWFIGAKGSERTFWTGFYYFYPTNELGISVANTVNNASSQMQAVIGVDLTFSLLKQFLLEQKVGRRGKVFIVEENGKEILPEPEVEVADPEGVTQSVVSGAFQRFLSHQNEDFLYKQDGVQYLVHVSKIPVIFGHDWKVLIIFPLEDYLSQLFETQKEVIFIILGILCFSSVVVVYFASRISSPIVTLSSEVNKITELSLDSNVRVSSKIKEISLMDDSIARLRSAIRSFACYVPKEIVRKLIGKGGEIKLGGEKKEITIFFSDIENFTAIAEHYPIERLTPLLAEYFDVLSKTILSLKGTVDKYIGDGVMAFWGAPIEMADPCVQACLAALYCKARIDHLNFQRQLEEKPLFLTRFGLHLGNVIVGNIGTNERMNYTIIGDAVNTASRLQNINKVYQTKIIISEDLHSELKNLFVTRPLDVVTVKGKTEKTKILELVGVKEGDSEIQASPQVIELCTRFTEAYEAYHCGEKEKAKKLFQAIQQQFPADGPTKTYLELLL